MQRTGIAPIPLLLLLPIFFWSSLAAPTTEANYTVLDGLTANVTAAITTAAVTATVTATVPTTAVTAAVTAGIAIRGEGAGGGVGGAASRSVSPTPALAGGSLVPRAPLPPSGHAA
jgi:hypothetical protein